MVVTRFQLRRVRLRSLDLAGRNDTVERAFPASIRLAFEHISHIDQYRTREWDDWAITRSVVDFQSPDRVLKHKSNGAEVGMCTQTCGFVRYQRSQWHRSVRVPGQVADVVILMKSTQAAGIWHL